MCQRSVGDFPSSLRLSKNWRVGRTFSSGSPPCFALGKIPGKGTWDVAADEHGNEAKEKVGTGANNKNLKGDVEGEEGEEP